MLVRNETPDRLVVNGPTDALVLSPLQTVRVDFDPQERLGAAALEARRDRALSWETEPTRTTQEAMASVSTVVGVGTAVAAAAVAVVQDGVLLSVPLAAVALACLAAVATINRRSELAAWQLARGAAVHTLYALCLLLVVAAGIAAPAVAVYYGSELSQIWVLHDWPPRLPLGADSQFLVVARVLQVALLGIVALLPGLMFFQFDREQLSTIVERWLHGIFRLDPTVHTVSDVEARYGRRVEEFYGASLTRYSTTVRRRRRTPAPVLVATLLIALGWVLTLLNERAEVGVDELQQMQFADVLLPSLTPVTLAFLGAYFFALQVVLRGYVRGDLRAKTYTMISARIVTAVILAWVLEVVFTDPSDQQYGVELLVLSFLAGVVPDTVLRRLRDVPAWLGNRGGAAGRDGELDDRLPLTALDGIDIYERTRLAEEGITNTQALAYHDIIDLTLSTRIPMGRVVDWVDQAILHQHVPAQDVRKLRRHGVRAASELRAVVASNGRRALVPAMDEARLRNVLAALAHAEWLAFVENWRHHEEATGPSTRSYGSERDEPVVGSHIADEAAGLVPTPRQRPPVSSPRPGTRTRT